jgi:2-polyprenyl-3-methyl-5-hydroxy-6-metoxy-1,4-benzoquinol methylase
MEIELNTSTPSRYSFDNDDPEAVDRHSYLSEMNDPFTFDRLSRLGPLTGWRCLEVGAGGGSVARWLAEQAGPAGRVLATDLKPGHLPADATYSILQHDLRFEPVPDGPWDLIHARLVLLHIAERREIVARLVQALAPGGYLVLEDMASSQRRLVLASPDAYTTGLVDEYQDYLLQILPTRGNDPQWAEKTYGVLLEEGLVDVSTEIRSDSWPGGTAGTRLISANVAQLRADFAAVGYPQERLEQLCAAMEDPRVVLRSHYIYSTVGRRRS